VLGRCQGQRHWAVDSYSVRRGDLRFACEQKKASRNPSSGMGQSKSTVHRA
jgi:hypothetical protein